ncbi:MAG: low molecular weight protein-tyrosine-phosphatase [Bacteroidales bacterium]|nr:low molecular weight protein-tyrosine-phosphatase [Bacteroidales bacterium]
MKILMVCLGNICRSPLAQGILEEKIQQRGLNASVDSAGTAAYHIGEKPDSRSIQIAVKHNVNISSQTARQFEVSDFDRFDRIYAMDRHNYEDILALARNEEDRKKVDMILNASRPGKNNSVPDPYYSGREGFQKVYAMLDEACEVIAGDIAANS